MKRISFIITALLLLAALTQCKKDVQVSPANEGNTVDITLNIKGGGGPRVDVNTATGAVNYENGDKIYVVSGGKYVGTLTHNGTCFGGTITDPTVGEPLYFYFLGNVTPAEPLVTGVTTTCSVVISDQTERLPVIACAPSNENYVSGLTTFTAMLINQCALVKFNVTTASETATCIIGMKNKVTVDFSSDTLAYSQEGNGVITLPAGSGERWAILLPQEALEAGTVGSAYSENEEYTGICGAIPAIVDNSYYTTGIRVVVNLDVNSGNEPIGAICGKFTINANGDQVYFSKGNLQYNKTTDEWSFMEHQYDIVENNGQNVGVDYAKQNIVSLFGWGTSGWDNGNIYYQPYNTRDNNNCSTGYGYGPTDGMFYDFDLIGTWANADWGIYNAIVNGGNIPDLWRVLTSFEWYYILYTRHTFSGIRYAKAEVNGVNGVILFPDNWNASDYELNGANRSNVDYNANVITAENWGMMESNGVVFLPTSGYRSGRQVFGVGTDGNYWTSSCWHNCETYVLRITNTYLAMNEGHLRFIGRSVRLVCPTL